MSPQASLFTVAVLSKTLYSSDEIITFQTLTLVMSASTPVPVRSTFSLSQMTAFLSALACSLTMAAFCWVLSTLIWRTSTGVTCSVSTVATMGIMGVFTGKDFTWPSAVGVYVETLWNNSSEGGVTSICVASVISPAVIWFWFEISGCEKSAAGLMS